MDAGVRAGGDSKHVADVVAELCGGVAGVLHFRGFVVSLYLQLEGGPLLSHRSVGEGETFSGTRGLGELDFDVFSSRFGTSGGMII